MSRDQILYIACWTVIVAIALSSAISFIISNNNWERDAVRVGAGQYNVQSGNFEWVAEAKYE